MINGSFGGCIEVILAGPGCGFAGFRVAHDMCVRDIRVLACTHSLGRILIYIGWKVTALRGDITQAHMTPHARTRSKMDDAMSL